MRSYGRSEGPSWGVWVLGVVLVVVLVGVVALTIYGGQVHPVQQDVEQVIPNDRFAR
ncbi:type VI protein secretion system component VasK [Rhizomicrobium palustre]|uniref:Type VI protein secretion system component VasK n=1 Tax=Rhizomicrobium palustre TaxID=189966 RepID=A0A846N4A6_9PROT|nr:hypothetical protein [Rhizomicrobium palustre]NIK90032.1 type VI protein secretion system component VasK [Rhizomicrobium palustre]